LEPLYSLLCKNKKWVWTATQDAAFKLAKDALQIESVFSALRQHKTTSASM